MKASVSRRAASRGGVAILRAKGGGRVMAMTWMKWWKRKNARRRRGPIGEAYELGVVRKRREARRAAEAGLDWREKAAFREGG